MCITCSVSLTASYPLLRHGAPEEDALNFHLDNVQCSGNESTLSECDHQGIGFHDCNQGSEEAGVICSSKTYMYILKAMLSDSKSLQMYHVLMEQFTWWIVIVYPVVELSTAIRVTGGLCVPVTGVKRRLEWSVEHWAMTQLCLVSV